ncbi:hypothetical protein CR513_51997, partial [Mucuna pruriens]
MSGSNGNSNEANDFLTTEVIMEEIKRAIWSNDGNKIPGLYNFIFIIFKHHREMIKLHTINNLFSKFRPILLVTSIYKIISKVQASKLKLVLHKVISSVQTPFLLGRQIFYDSLTVNELVDLAKKGKIDCLIIKVSFEKVYVSVYWDFLDHTMQRTGFCNEWREWINLCFREV